MTYRNITRSTRRLAMAAWLGATLLPCHLHLQQPRATGAARQLLRSRSGKRGAGAGLDVTHRVQPCALSGAVPQPGTTWVGAKIQWVASMPQSEAGLTARRTLSMSRVLPRRAAARMAISSVCSSTVRRVRASRMAK